MDFHLDRRLLLNTDPKYKNLYSWAINEIDSDDKVVGADQVPWVWSLYFTATEIALSDSITVKAWDDIRRRLLQKVEIEYGRRISAKLRPGHPLLGEKATYRMLGTDRVISKFQLTITPLKTDDEIENCHAWGSVSYTWEADFRHETTEDEILFQLRVKPSTFDRYAARISDRTTDEVTLIVSNVEGFYSRWSPSISTRDVKVLTEGREQEVRLPGDFKFEPPRLGLVGEANLNINARLVQARTQPSPVDDEVADDDLQPTPIVRPEVVVTRSDDDPEMKKLLKSLKRSAHWIIGMLVALVITILLK